jgi:predicted tellurium resistance membrane protein TerC
VALDQAAFKEDCLAEELALLTAALDGLGCPSFIARLLQKHRWIAYVGLAIILYVSVEMIYRGALEVWPLVNGG